MRTAFAISGGASLGASQAGMLEALYERGIRPDVLVGTSVGAINAAFIASREPSRASAHELQAIWRGLSRGQVFPANPLTAGLGLLGLRDHSVPVDSLRRLIREHIEIERLEEAPVALHVIAVDALSGEEVMLSQGPAVEAILASAAVPGVFPPVPWGAQMLVDGGVLNNTPISHAVALGAERIYVLPAMGSRRLTRAPRGVVAAGFGALSRSLTQRLAQDIVLYADAAELIVLPAPCGSILPTDFGRADQLIAEGLERARATLANGAESAVVPLAA